MRRVVPAAALLALLTGARGPDAAPQTYRTATDLVSIYATVTDATGRLVPDLTREDFVVKDNGRKQPITFFSREIQPISVIVMLDGSPSMAPHAADVRAGAREFLGRLLPADRVRLGTFGSEIRIVPDTFTTDHAVLAAALDRAPDRSAGSPIWTALDRSITALRDQAGRRVVVVFTDGENAPLRGQVVTDLKDVIWRARYNDVMIYTIGYIHTGGLSPFGAGRGRFARPAGTSPDARAARRALQDLAAESGGGYFEMQALDSLAATFARVADELHRQYWIGFAPPVLDNRMHRLEVTAARRSLTVQARKSYFAGSDGR